MENKSKVFTKKLVALFLAVVMAVACFSGVISASAYSKGGYHDANLSDAYNYLTWTEPTSNQTAEALLDLVDRAIGDMNVDLNLNLEGHYVVIDFKVNVAWPNIDVEINKATIQGCLDSIDGAIDLIYQVWDFLENSSVMSNGTVVNLLGDIPLLKVPLRYLASNRSEASFRRADSSKTTAGDWRAVSTDKVGCGKSWRENMSAQEMISAVLKFINALMTATDNSAGLTEGLAKKIINGNFSLGEAVQNVVLKKQTLYDIIKGALGAWDGYQTNLAYNVVAALMFNNTNWFTDEEVTAYRANMSNFRFEDVLLQKLSTEVLQKISVLVTYPNLVNYTNEYPAGTDENGNPIIGYFKDSSARRKFYIEKTIRENGWTGSNVYQRACTYINNYIANNPNGIYGSVPYDANLVYSTEEGMENNVLLFQYTGVDSFAVKKDDTLYSLAIPALRLAWKTAIAPTLGLVQPNFAGFETDYDNAFYQWQSSHGGWDKSDLAATYARANVEAWAADVYADYEAADAAAFLAKVEEFYTGLDRAAVAASEAKYNWRDMDVTTLFNKLRYSPLADKYFNVQTGPLNLYLMQTGYPNIEAFLKANVYDDNTYNGLVEGIYDFLMAAMADLFPKSNNIAGSVPELDPIGNNSNNKTNAQIASALVSKAAEIFEYAANATDLNILSPFYHEYGSTAHISESNFEAAIIPMAIAILKQWNLTESIHDSMWDRAKDFEGLAAIALNEYLSFVFPSRDYTALWEYDATDKHIKAKSGENMMDNVLLPMVRDALGYVLTAEGVPLYKPAGSRASWNPYTDSYVADAKNGVSASQVERSTSLWDLANGVLCYYATEENFDTSSGPMASPGKGMAAVFGLQGQIATSNTLWANLNLIANRVLPALGKLQGNNYGAFDSYDLFYNKIVTGLVDMDENGGGLTNFATQFLTICKAEPIASHGIVQALYYDLIVPFVNAVANTTLLSTNVQTYPFDSLLDNTNGKLANLLGQLTGVLNTRLNPNNAGGTGLWKTISYVLTAINAIPELKVHYAGGVSARFPSNVIYNSSSINTTLTIRNESFGLNKFYRLFGGLDITSMGDIRESGRYYVNITGLSAEEEGSNGSTSNANSKFSYGNYSGEIAPEKDKAVSVKSIEPLTPGKVYTFNVTYDVYVDKDITDNNNTKQKVQSGLVAKEYLYIAPSGTQAAEASWDSEVYGIGFGAIRPFWEDVNPETDVINETHAAGVSSDNEWTHSTQASNGFYATVPHKFIVDANYPRGAHDRGYRVTNNNGSSYKLSSIYAYPVKDYEYHGVWYDENEGVVIEENTTKVQSNTSDQESVFVAVNQSGALLNNEGRVVMSLENAIAEGCISGIDYKEDNENRVYRVALSDWDSVGAYDLKLATPAPGVYLEKRTIKDAAIEANSYKDYALLDWNSNATEEGHYTFNLLLKTSNSRQIRITDVVLDAIGDYGALTNTIDNYTNILASYTASDFGSTAEYNALRAAITDAVKATAESKVTYNNVATFTTLDAKRAAIENAYKAATITGGDLGQKVYNQVIKERQDLVDADYNLFAFRSMETAAWDTEWFVGSSEPLKDANGETLYDEQGRTLHTYFTMTSKAMIDNRINLFEDAHYQLTEYSKRGYNGDKIEAEVIHATSITDEYDDVIAATAHEDTLDMIVSEDTSRQAYRFAYSTLDPKVKDDVTPYKVRIDYNGANMKFGRVDANRYLVNEDAEGNPIYTEKSWYAYVDALGECLNAIKNKQPISKTYNATKHLVIAENHLEKLPEVPVVGDGIAISGTVVIATNMAGTAGDVGVGGLTVSANGADSVLTAADGSFTIYVPAGTTAITVSGESSVPRTVTLSGTAAVSDAVIPVCICDYSGDKIVNSLDVITYNSYYNKAYVDAAYYTDFNHDRVINSLDTVTFNTFYDKGTINYNELNLD